MTTDDETKCDPLESEGAFSGTGSWYLLLLLVLCLFEYSYIRYVWFRPYQTIDLMFKICLQLIVLIPAFDGLGACIKVRKKLKTGEISLAYASELSSWLVIQQIGVYFAFVFLVGLVRH